MNSTSQAAPVCEPKNRDVRPSRCGELARTRMTAKTTSATSTATAKKSSRKPSHGQWPMIGMWKSRSNSAP